MQGCAGNTDLVLWQLCAHYIEKFAVIWRMFLAKRFLSGKLEKYHDARGVGWGGGVAEGGPLHVVDEFLACASLKS